MKARPYSSWITRVFIFVVGMLAFTGFMQMPLARRYYLTDVPGMAWTGDFFLVHKLHYGFAIVLLFLVGMVMIHWLMEWKDQLALTPLGMARVVILGGLIVSGGLRVYRNLPGVTMHPDLVMLVEWVHFGLVMVLGGVALAALIRKRSAYAIRR